MAGVIQVNDLLFERRRAMNQTLPDRNAESILSTDGQNGNVQKTDVLDFESLVNRCMGNFDFVDRVLIKINERLPIDIEEMQQALELQDAQKLAGVAHRIKGSVANISAKGLQHTAQVIEEMGRAGRIEDISTQIDSFRNEWERLRAWSELFLTKKISG
jgi:HPt (histidine-containing phosphotransfer) domain-containing protein